MSPPLPGPTALSVASDRRPRTSPVTIGAALLGLLLVVMTSYNLWRLRAVAMDDGLQSAAQYANAFEEHLTQTLGVAELSLIGLAEQNFSATALTATLRNARYLRSVSELDANGVVLRSSEPRNIGRPFPRAQMLPAIDGVATILRVGPLWAGRDLWDAQPVAPNVDVPAPSLIAIERTVALPDGRFVVLVATLNPDYFANYYGRNLDSADGDVTLFRLDGNSVLSTANRYRPGAPIAAQLLQRVGQTESGALRLPATDGAKLSAYRVSRAFPIAVQVELSERQWLQAWRQEAQISSAVAAALLVAIGGLSALYRRRVLRLSAEREVWVQDLNNQKYALDQHAIVSITDIDGCITYANDRFCSISGYSRDELLGKNHRLIKSETHPPEFFTQLWKTIGRGDVWHGEICNRRKNGALYWVNATIVPLLGVDGSVQQYIAIRTDISDRKAIEHSLEVAKDVAEQANTAKSQFLANMSHEIRTPMNGILGLLTLLQRTELSPTQRDYIQKTDSAARALLALLNDVLDFSKIEAGKLQLAERPFQLVALLRDVEVILQGALGSKPVQCRLDLPPDLPDTVLGDDLRLQQVLLNLGGNAIKFTDSGEVGISVRKLSSDGQKVRLEFRVRDTGIGISPAQHQKIFEGFAQAEASTTRRFGGSGLGLAIARQLVQLMGSDIALESSPGAGSVFYFAVTLAVPSDLPQLESPGHSRSAIATRAPQKRLAGMRLLLVEDNKINQMVAQTLLEQEGAQIVLADNGALGVQAVELTRSAAGAPPFDAVLMDLQMPVMDGFEATRRLRNTPANAALPILAITANTAPADRQACLDVGMNDHIGKPFQIDALVDKLLRCTASKSRSPNAQRTHQSATQSNTQSNTQSSTIMSHDLPPQTPQTPPTSMDKVHTEPSAALNATALAVLDEAAALERLSNLPHLYHTVLNGFASDLPTLTQRVAKALEEHDGTAAARDLHTLKGLAATIGAVELSSVAIQLERQIKAGPTDAASVMAQLESTIERLSGPLADALHRYRPTL